MLYAKYFELKKDLNNVTFGGRLGEYKYLDMDQSIASAMSKLEKLIVK
jgi:UDP-galactopyranose mutase